jgi:hypothetical protein
MSRYRVSVLDPVCRPAVLAALRNHAEFAALRMAVRTILDTGIYHLDWTVQGFGMLRCYPDRLDSSKRFRLNIWDSRLMVPGVSVIHDHPWSFDSWIINGDFYNIRYVEDAFSGDEYSFMVIKTGEGGGPDGSAGMMRLRPAPAEHYSTGEKYHQDPTEIHMSAYANGTVTLNDRTRVGDGEHARVFWPRGQSWVDAEPRKATRDEIERVVWNALRLWQ